MTTLMTNLTREMIYHQARVAHRFSLVWFELTETDCLKEEEKRVRI